MSLTKVQISNMTLGKYMKQCREKAGVSQRVVAIHLGFTTAQFVSNVERGISPLPIKQAERWLKFIEANKKTAWELMCIDYKRKTKRALGV